MIQLHGWPLCKLYVVVYIPYWLSNLEFYHWNKTIDGIRGLKCELLSYQPSISKLWLASKSISNDRLYIKLDRVEKIKHISERLMMDYWMIISYKCTWINETSLKFKLHSQNPNLIDS